MSEDILQDLAMLEEEEEQQLEEEALKLAKMTKAKAKKSVKKVEQLPDILNDLALIEEEKELEQATSKTTSKSLKKKVVIQIIAAPKAPLFQDDSNMQQAQACATKSAPKTRGRPRKAVYNEGISKAKKVKSIVVPQEPSAEEQPTGILSDLALFAQEEREQQLEDKAARSAAAKAKRKSKADTPKITEKTTTKSTKKVRISPEELITDEEPAPLSARQLEMEDMRNARREAGLQSASLRPSVAPKKRASRSSTSTTSSTAAAVEDADTGLEENPEIETNALYRDSPIGQALRSALKDLAAKDLIDSNDPTKKDWDKKIFSLFDTSFVNQIKQVTSIKTKQLMEENTNISKFYSKDRLRHSKLKFNNVEDTGGGAREESNAVKSKVVLKRYNNKPMLVQGELHSYINLRKYWRVDLENVTLNTGDTVLDRGNVRVLIKAPDERKTIKKAGRLNSKRKKAKETRKEEEESEKAGKKKYARSNKY